VEKAETLLMNDHARVLFFATLRDKAGVKETRLEFSAGASIAEIKNLVLCKFPALEQFKESMIVAMNHEFAADDQIVSNEAEIAMFPPVSGGEMGYEKYTTIAAIVNQQIDIDALLEKITIPTTGGICTFVGTVRGVTKRGSPHETEQLEYEAYQAMAEAKIQQICNEIRSRWNEIEGMAIVQRVGSLIPGEIAVVVACAASHRDMGIFEAARYGIDRLKEIVPVWKKEVGKEGQVWVEGEYFPQKGE
jgi:molybdopterin synthase catalytic subunit